MSGDSHNEEDGDFTFEMSHGGGNRFGVHVHFEHENDTEEQAYESDTEEQAYESDTEEQVYESDTEEQAYESDSQYSDSVPPMDENDPLVGNYSDSEDSAEDSLFDGESNTGDQYVNEQDGSEQAEEIIDDEEHENQKEYDDNEQAEEITDDVDHENEGEHQTRSSSATAVSSSPETSPTSSHNSSSVPINYWLIQPITFQYGVALFRTNFAQLSAVVSSKIDRFLDKTYHDGGDENTTRETTHSGVVTHVKKFPNTDQVLEFVIRENYSAIDPPRDSYTYLLKIERLNQTETGWYPYNDTDLSREDRMLVEKNVLRQFRKFARKGDPHPRYPPDVDSLPHDWNAERLNLGTWQYYDRLAIYELVGIWRTGFMLGIPGLRCFAWTTIKHGLLRNWDEADHHNVPDHVRDWYGVVKDNLREAFLYLVSLRQDGITRKLYELTVVPVMYLVYSDSIKPPPYWAQITTSNYFFDWDHGTVLGDIYDYWLHNHSGPYDDPGLLWSTMRERNKNAWGDTLVHIRYGEIDKHQAVKIHRRLLQAYVTFTDDYSLRTTLEEIPPKKGLTQRGTKRGYGTMTTNRVLRLNWRLSEDGDYATLLVRRHEDWFAGDADEEYKIEVELETIRLLRDWLYTGEILPYTIVDQWVHLYGIAELFGIAELSRQVKLRIYQFFFFFKRSDEEDLNVQKDDDGEYIPGVVWEEKLEDLLAIIDLCRGVPVIANLWELCLHILYKLLLGKRLATPATLPEQTPYDEWHPLIMARFADADKYDSLVFRKLLEEVENLNDVVAWGSQDLLIEPESKRPRLNWPEE